MNYGKALQRIRFEKELKQTDVAKSAKISQTYLSQVEGGTKIPSQDVLNKLCHVYGIPLAVLTWSATEDKDVKQKHKTAFKKIKGPMDELISEFFTKK